MNSLPINSIPPEKRVYKTRISDVDGFYEQTCVFGWLFDGNPLLLMLYHLPPRHFIPSMPATPKHWYKR